MRPIPSPVTVLLAALLMALTWAVAGPASAQLVPGLGGGDAAAEEGSGDAAGAEAGTAEDPLAQLLGVLQDDAARARLVEQLQEATTPAEGEAEASAAQEEPRTLGQRVAETTQGVAESVIGNVERIWATVGRAPSMLSGFGADEIGVLVEALRDLLLIIAATVATFLVLRTLAIPIYRRIGARVGERSVAGRVLPFLGAGLMDIAIVLLAWAIGYAIAIFAFGDMGQIELRQTLYLNAFLAVEMVKAVLRLLISPSTAALRPVQVSDRGARRLYRVCKVTTSIVGYGLLLVLPIVAENAGFAAERSAGVLMWLAAILYLGAAVLRFRRPVADWLVVQTAAGAAAPAATREGIEDADAAETSVAADAPAAEAGAEPEKKRRLRFARHFAAAWYWPVLIWLLWILVIALSRRSQFVVEALVASGQVALLLLAGIILSGMLGRAIARGITLPQGLNQRVPLLESRLNKYVPRILFVLRLVILVVVLFFAIDTLNFVNARGWVESDVGLSIAGVIVSVGLIVLAAFVIWLAMASWVDYRLNPDFGKPPTAREETLLTLLRNAATIALLILTLMFALSEIGLNIGPLLASAGVVGLAIGFGAQKMVQDIITGIFIQFENAINVGDVVTAGGITGVVEKLTVRSVSLRDLDGAYHIIPFSSVDLVTNFMRDFSFYLADLGVAYRENVDDVKQAMFDAFEELRIHPEQGGFILGDLEWFGLNSFGDSAIVMRARIKTWPGKQWGVGRAYNEIIKRIFDERGIEIPFPHTTVWFGEDREGKAPPLRVAGRMETRTETVRRRREEIGETGGSGDVSVATPTQDAPPDDAD